MLGWLCLSTFFFFCYFVQNTLQRWISLPTTPVSWYCVYVSGKPNSWCYIPDRPVIIKDHTFSFPGITLKLYLVKTFISSSDLALGSQCLRFISTTCISFVNTQGSNLNSVKLSMNAGHWDSPSVFKCRISKIQNWNSREESIHCSFCYLSYCSSLNKSAIVLSKLRHLPRCPASGWPSFGWYVTGCTDICLPA